MTSMLELQRDLQTALDLGEYTIEVSQKVRVGGSSETFATKQAFLVAGPRFVLEPAEILSTFPVPNTNGDYNGFLPYVTIRRATLPWERRVTRSTDDPFLALLVVTKQERDELLRVRSQRIEDFCRERGLTLQSSDDPDALIPVIEAEGSVLAERLPSRSELALLCHVRRRDGQPAEAVILGNRRPLPMTRYEVHLVSLEGQDPDSLSAGTIKLPSLYRWEFTCGTDRVSIVERLREVDCDGLRLPGKEASSPGFEALRSAGYAALPYALAWGDRSHGLYRGPLLPVSTSEPLGDTLERAAGLDSSEGLIDYFTDLELPDISLAAAWELGRMLLLRRRHVAVEYHRFRREQAGLSHQETNAAEELSLALHDVSRRPSSALPEAVVAFCSELIALRGVPFVYLVPEPRMLPETSLRVFRVDMRWIACLLGGALSLGRETTRDRERERSYLASLLSGIGERSGFFLRSPAVAEHPHQSYEIADASDRRLTNFVRNDRLANDVLMAMVEGTLRTITAKEEPRTAHFGFKESGGEAEQLSKDVRNPVDFQETGRTVTLGHEHYRNQALGVLDVRALATSLAAKSSQVESHHLALQLIESGAAGFVVALGGNP